MEKHILTQYGKLNNRDTARCRSRKEVVYGGQ